MTLPHLSFPLRPFASVSWLDAVFLRVRLGRSGRDNHRRVRQCDVVTHNSRIGSFPRDLRTLSRRTNRTSNVHREVVVAQTCHFSERNGLYLHHFVLIYENSPLTSTFTVNQCAAETSTACKQGRLSVLSILPIGCSRILGVSPVFLILECNWSRRRLAMDREWEPSPVDI